MALPSSVAITYDQTEDITNHVIAAETSFELLMSAMAGSASLAIKDEQRTLFFETGREIWLDVDGERLWAGYITNIRRTFAFPVVDTTQGVDQVRARKWILSCSDFNVLFDKRVLRNEDNYLNQIPNFTSDTYDGELIREALTDAKYFDIDDSEFDVVSEVDNVVRPFDPLNEGDAGDGAWVQQGSTMRTFMEDLVQFSGAVYYFKPDKTLLHKALETTEARWGFSDLPTNGAITGAVGYQDETIGFRELDALEEGGPATMVNDALIWGGSEFAGEGQTVFARAENESSQASYGRWQIGEMHFGETGFRQQRGVNARANVIVNGEPGSVGGDPNRGLRFPQWQITLAWFAHQVPTISGNRDHLRPGDIVRIELHSYGYTSANPHVLPLRRISISFPSLHESGDAWVKMQGTFGLQLSDPYTLWRYLLKLTAGRTPVPISAVDGDNPAPFGAIFSGEPTPTPDGSTTLFELPDSRGYIGGTAEVYLDGLLQRPGIEFDETDPDLGQITFADPPAGGSWIWIVCRVT
ncbi:MAG TPA: hypothetical protein VN756_08920 [Solirubrobacterales bacterium]|nr:hypothetical protein [Solirubrobacterales bacterium]